MDMASLLGAAGGSGEATGSPDAFASGLLAGAGLRELSQVLGLSRKREGAKSQAMPPAAEMLQGQMGPADKIMLLARAQQAFGAQPGGGPPGMPPGMPPPGMPPGMMPPGLPPGLMPPPGMPPGLMPPPGGPPMMGGPPPGMLPPGLMPPPGPPPGLLMPPPPPGPPGLMGAAPPGPVPPPPGGSLPMMLLNQLLSGAQGAV